MSTLGDPREIANIQDAKSRLAPLVERALHGLKVVIAQAGKPLARLTPVARDVSPRVGGPWRGRVRMAEDLDSLPDDLAETFGATSERRFLPTPNP